MAKKYQLGVLLISLGCSGSVNPSGGASGASDEPAAPLADAASEDSIRPAADDPASFERRFAAVESIVGQGMAGRVMVKAEEGASLLYELELPNGNELEWYELADGIPYVAEFGSAPTALTVEQQRVDQTPDELFRSLAPSAEVPEVLLRLTERQREMAPVYRALAVNAERFADVHLPLLTTPVDESIADRKAPALQTDAVGKVQQAITVQECLNLSVGCNGGLSFPWRESRADATADTKITSNDRMEVRGAGCCHSGNVTYRVRYRTWFTWTLWFRHDLPTNFKVGGWTLGDPSLDFDFEGRMYNFDPGDRATQCAGGR